MYYVLLYDYVKDVAERRAPHREGHLGLLRQLHKDGHVAIAGAWANPLDGAAIVFRGDTPDAAQEFVRADPYVKNGLVAQWRIREWAVAIGGQ